MLFALHHSISPAAMKALLCTRYGTPDDLTLAEIPDPVAGPGEVVVRVEAAALNFFDTLIIANKYQTKPPLPFSPAAECAGTVEALGGGVTNFAIGDRVMAYTGYGAARERIAVSAERLVRIPDSLDADRAAGLCVTYGTTLHALKDRGKLKAGETLAVLGASGGTGLAAIELGKLMRAHVIACRCAIPRRSPAESTGKFPTVRCSMCSCSICAATAAQTGRICKANTALALTCSVQCSLPGSSASSRVHQQPGK